MFVRADEEETDSVAYHSGSDDFDKIVREYQMASRLVKMKKAALAQAEAAKASSKIAELNGELESVRSPFLASLNPPR